MRCDHWGLVGDLKTSLGRNFQTGQAGGGIVLQGTKDEKSFSVGENRSDT